MSGSGFLGNRAILRLLAANAEARRSGESTRSAAEQPTTVDAGDVPPSPHASFAAHCEQGADSVDAVAGSEFVDDRIRLQE
jgi:hypothetical protein